MRQPQLFRIIHINFVLIKHGLDKIVLSIPLFAPIRFLAYFNPWNSIWQNEGSRGEKIRHALEELGPIFVKFGQALSTRKDLLPDDITSELAKLQDCVPPFPGEQAVAIITTALGAPITSLFSSFDIVPLASASIAQVHTATLFDGKEVVVKVVRPGIEKTIQRDVRLLYTLANLAERYWSEGRRLHLHEVIQQFERHITEELDLEREAANAAQLRRNFLNSPMLYIPEVYWDYTRKPVMVMERIWGIPISDIPALVAANIDLKILAEKGVDIFFTQVFRDSFFHADMHPGNIFVSTTHTENPRYIAIDFGIVGFLSKKDKRYLAENILAFLQRDYLKIAELHVASGWIPAHTSVEEFAAAIRVVCEPAFERPLKDISFALMLIRLFQTGRRFQMEVQPQLVLLQKTLLNIEALGKQLYPELDLWVTAKPFLERYLRQQLGPQAFITKLQESAPYWLEKLPEMPELLYETLRRMQDLSQIQGALPVKVKSAEQNRRMRRQSRLNGFGFALVLCALLNFTLWQHEGNLVLINIIILVVGVVLILK